MANVSTSLLERQYMKLLDDEAFLLQLEEILKNEGEIEEAKTIREMILRIRSQRLKVKESISR